MMVTLQISDDVAKSIFDPDRDFARQALEAIAIEGSRSGMLAEEQVRALLGFETRLEVDAFLKSHEVYRNYTIDDVRRDTEVSRLHRERTADKRRQAA